MKKIDYIKFSFIKERLGSGILTSFVCFLAYYFVVAYPLSFNYSTFINGHYSVVFIAFLALCFFSFFYLVRVERIRVLPSVFLLIFLLWYAANQLYTYGNEYAAVVISLLIVNMIFLHIDFFGIKIMAGFFFLLFCYEAVVVFDEFSLLKGADILPIGTMFNSGILSQYFVLHLPFFWLILFSSRVKSLLFFQRFKWLAFFLFSGVIVLMFYLSIRMSSRTSMVAIVGMLCLILFYEKGNYLKEKLVSYSWKTKYAVTAVLISIAGYFSYTLFHYKLMSSLGRLVIWKVNLLHMRDYFWTGTGLGRYTWFYPQWQSQYFERADAPSINTFLSAGETYIAFNEFLEIFMSMGIIGLLVFLVILVFFYSLQSTENKRWLIFAKIMVTGILLCSFTSYPLHVNIISLFLVFSLAIGFRMGTSVWLNRLVISTNSTVKVTIVWMLILLSGYSLYHGGKQYLAARKWIDLREDYGISRKEIYKTYDNLLPILGKDGKFLAEYGILLGEDHDQVHKASALLERTKRYFISYKTVKDAAYLQWKIKDYNSAAINLKWLSNYIPSKFAIKLDLLKIYQESGKINEALNMVETIRRMPVKIPSPEVLRIRKETERIATEIANTTN